MYKNNRAHARDPYNYADREAPVVMAWETVEPEYQDSGANDEGYYYQWCCSCEARQEHADGSCIACETA